MRGDARLPPSLFRPCDITQRTTKLKLRGSDNCRHYTNHGSHTEPPTTACTASERVEWSRSLHPAARSFFQAKRKGSGKSKEGSADGQAGGGMGSRQRQIIEALSIDVSTAISDPPTVNECPWPNLPSVDERSGDFDSGANLSAHLASGREHRTSR